jgi:succinate dehydrogenase hydrophobic anchor subunit
MDYVHPLAIRLLVLSLIGATLMLFAFWCFAILIRMLWA